MIATKMAVFMTAAVIVGGISIVPFLPGAEAGPITTSRSNIKSMNIAQQEADQSCTNQAQGQGGQQAVPNTEQNTIVEEGDPVPGWDVSMSGISSEGDPTVDATQSVECSIAMEQTVGQNADTVDFSTNEWTE